MSTPSFIQSNSLYLRLLACEAISRVCVRERVCVCKLTNCPTCANAPKYSLRNRLTVNCHKASYPALNLIAWYGADPFPALLPFTPPPVCPQGGRLTIILVWVPKTSRNHGSSSVVLSKVNVPVEILLLKYHELTITLRVIIQIQQEEQAIQTGLFSFVIKNFRQVLVLRLEITPNICYVL